MKLPQAKTANLVVQHLTDEVLIYNLATDQAFHLNGTAAKVFNACDGEQQFADLKKRCKFSDDLIYLALDDLKEKDLIEDYQSIHFKGLSRREVIRKVGFASMIALPVISSMIAPPAANAASGALRANGVSCSANNQCTSSRCGQNGFGPSCCSSNDFGSCTISGDCCSGVACTGNVCCQGNGRVCDTRSPNQCCAGLTCVAPNGQFNGSCQ